MDKKVISITVNPEELKKITYFYRGSELEVANPYLLASYHVEGCTILIYQSLKVVFQGEKAYQEASIWQQIKNSGFRFTDAHAGSDEVGTGDFFGPIVVVACFIKDVDIDFLVNLGVGDSKLIDDARIRQMAPLLIARLAYSQLVLNNEQYNELVLKQQFNMNKIKAYMHNKAILNLQDKVKEPIPYFVIDQFTPENLYYRYLETEKRIARSIKFTTKGETASIAVACASIIARYSFIKRMDLLSKQYGMTIPKGAGSHVDEIANYILQKKGLIALNHIVKMNFKNYQRLNQISLEQKE